MFISQALSPDRSCQKAVNDVAIRWITALQYCNGRVDAVFEQMGQRKRVTDFRLGKKQGARNHVIKLFKPKVKPHWMSQEQYQSAPESLSVRELKVGRKVLINTMVSPKEA